MREHWRIIVVEQIRMRGGPVDERRVQHVLPPAEADQRARTIARANPKRRLRRDPRRPRSRAEQRDGERIKNGALRSLQHFRWNVIEAQCARPFRQLLERIRRHGRMRPCSGGSPAKAARILAKVPSLGW
jgi:hypothetical protein